MTRNRIKYLRRVRASELIRNEANFRRHTDSQRGAFGAMLREIGFAGAVVAREAPEGLVLIDGHMRADEAGDAEIPVLVLDVTESEAKTLLASLDPLAAMAEVDQQALKELTEGMAFDSDALTRLLAEMVEGHSAGSGGGDQEKPPEEPYVLLRHRSRRKYPATEGELHALWAALNWYVDTNAQPDGFVGWLLSRVPDGALSGSVPERADPASRTRC